MGKDVRKSLFAGGVEKVEWSMVEGSHSASGVKVENFQGSLKGCGGPSAELEGRAFPSMSEVGVSETQP